jgi:hypothetical protein
MANSDIEKVAKAHVELVAFRRWVTETIADRTPIADRTQTCLQTKILIEETKA